MARTRGASVTGIQDRDGVMLDRAGNPISPYAHTGKLSQADVHLAPPQEAPEPPPPVTRYICNETTLRRDLDAYTLARLLNIATGGMLEISLTPEQWMEQLPDVKQNFKPVRG